MCEAMTFPYPRYATTVIGAHSVPDRRSDGQAIGAVARSGSQCMVIGVLVDPSSPATEQLREGVEQGRRALGLRIEMAQSSNVQELDSAFATMVRAGAGGLLVGGGPFFFGQGQQIVALAARHALPASYATRNYAEAGGLMSYGPNQSDAYRQAGMLRRPHSPGRQAGRPAGRAGDQVRAGHQSEDGQGSRPVRSHVDAITRRRGDRIVRDVGYWHLADMRRAPCPLSGVERTSQLMSAFDPYRERTTG